MSLPSAPNVSAASGGAGGALRGASAGLRYHSLLGAVPLAGYLLLHLVGQGLAAAGSSWQQGVQAALQHPLVHALESLLIHGVLCTHVGLALWRWSEQRRAGVPASLGCRLSVWSAGVLLVFLPFHVWQFDGRLWAGQIRREDYLPELYAGLSSTAFGGVPLLAVLYLFGVGAASLHSALGVYRACLGWGLVSEARRPLWARACAAAGLCLFALGALIVIDLATGSLVVHFPG